MPSGGLRKYDPFVKTRPDMQSRSALGGIITLVASTTAGLLLLAQLIQYILGSPSHSLHLAYSKSTPLAPLNLTPLQSKILHRVGTIPVSLKVTFPHLKCRYLDVIHDGASLSSGEFTKHHPGHSITLRQASSKDIQAITQQPGFHDDQKDINSKNACTIEGEMRVGLVAGSLVLSMNALAWAEVTSLLSMQRLEDATKHTQTSQKLLLRDFNCTHFIHYLRFSQSFPHQAHQPLEKRYSHIDNNFGGIALEQVEVKLVPTHKTNYLGIQSSSPTNAMYQLSVNDHQVQPATLVAHGVPQLPGLWVAYDFSPIAVQHTGGRDNVLVFFSSLVSIVGGVFVTVGLLTSCLVHSAKAVAKKVD